MSDDPYDYTSPLMKTVPIKGRRGAPDDTVTIPRPQYEALMAAVKALPGAERIIGDMKGSDVWREYDAVCNALHALRAALRIRHRRQSG